MRKNILISILISLCILTPGYTDARKSVKTSKSQSRSNGKTVKTESVVNDDKSVYIVSTLDDGTRIITEVDPQGNVTVRSESSGNSKVATKNNRKESSKQSSRRVEQAVRKAEAQFKAAHEESKSALKSVTGKGTGAVKIYSGLPINYIRNTGWLDVEVKYADTPGIEVSGIDHGSLNEVIDYVNGEVEIRSASAKKISSKAKVTVYSNDLRSLFILGSGNVRCDKIMGRNLDVGIMGSGDLAIKEAMATSIRFLINGSGDIRCNSLSATTLQVAINGSGDLFLDKAMVTSLDCLVQGSGDTFLKGIEATTLSVSSMGSGDVTVSGKATSAMYSIRGTGDISVGGLKATRVSQTTYGTGEIIH
ncbi:MAG: DUF2807 domain-containing protein [Muribaculaceae bacterium]|nr:DUF2807 domain-containing protein [Muribaculaceae bacterium]